MTHTKECEACMKAWAAFDRKWNKAWEARKKAREAWVEAHEKCKEVKA